PMQTPLRKRVLVYVAHLSLGARSGSRRVRSSGSPSIDAAPTRPPASGPNKTAATSLGRIDIDCSSVRVSPRCATVNPTLIRSAIAAATARATTAQGDSSLKPTATRHTATTAAVRVSANTYAAVRRRGSDVVARAA